jgi:hypothetical protein
MKDRTKLRLARALNTLADWMRTGSDATVRVENAADEVGAWLEDQALKLNRCADRLDPRPPAWVHQLSAAGRWEDRERAEAARQSIMTGGLGLPAPGAQPPLGRTQGDVGAAALRLGYTASVRRRSRHAR